MRLRLGRPDLDRWRDLFDVPAAADRAGTLGVTFLGVSTLLIDDGDTALLTDGFFSRPGLLGVALGEIAPDRARIADCLRRAVGARASSIPQVRAVIPVHSHYDHALDSAEVARLNGAMLLGGNSTANLGRGAGLAEDQIGLVGHGRTWSQGSWSVRFTASAHCPPDRFPGEITAPVRPPARASAYRCGEAWSLLITHSGGARLLVQGSAGYVAGSLAGQQAEVAYLGVGQLGLQSADYITNYWNETVTAVGARRVVLTHWDDFFAPLPIGPGDRPLRAIPYAADDLDATMRELTGLAERDGVQLSFPTVWNREDPWA